MPDYLKYNRFFIYVLKKVGGLGHWCPYGHQSFIKSDFLEIDRADNHVLDIEALLLKVIFR